MDKAAWRHRIRSDRGTKRPEAAQAAQAAVHLGRFLDGAVPVGTWVVLYDAMPDEISLSPLVETHPEPAARYALTRTPDEGHRLTVHPVGGPTETHGYGYQQPRVDSPVVSDADIGAVLVPGLAFDRNGTRLGRGAGYYDRFLARLGPSVLRIGVTAGLVDGRLPADDHDVAMTHLATPDGVIVAPPGGGELSSG